jgi:Rad3-related DNA helicase
LLVVPMKPFAGPQGRVIHSSFTKAQQAQMGRDGADLVRLGVFTDVVEVRGRSEYLCHTRRRSRGLPEVEVTGPTGLRSDCPPMSDEEWGFTHSDSDDGCGPECGVENDFALKMRARARREGALLVVNHSLLILDHITRGALLGVLKKGPLDPNSPRIKDVLVLDEAHQAAGAFRSALGANFSIARLTRLARLAEREMVPLEFTPETLKRFSAWLLAANLEAAKKATGDDFMYLTDLSGLKAVRPWAKLAAESTSPAVARSAGRLVSDLDETSSRLTDGSGVAWVTGVPRRVEYRPLDVRTEARSLFSSFAAAVATSATVDGHPMAELGGGVLVKVGSPFNEARNRVAVISTNGKGGQVDEARRLNELVLCAKRAKGGVLVLAATNKTKTADGRWMSLMEVCGERLIREGFRVGVQHSPADVPWLVEGLRSGALNVVVGTMSMREGIDIQGSALSMVVLMGLQWPYMGDPLLKAQMLRAGGSKWSVVTPITESNTRQAIGRLLRGVDDTGHVVLLDGRHSATETFRKLVAPSPVKVIV